MTTDGPSDGDIENSLPAPGDRDASADPGEHMLGEDQLSLDASATGGGELKPSVEEHLRILANQDWNQQLANDMQDDGDGKDATNLANSLGHFEHGLASNHSAPSQLFSAFKAQMDRAQQRNEREVKQQIQINLIEDREEKKRKAEEDAEEEFEGSVDRLTADQKREREAWSKSTHRFGNVEMTGEEWGQLAEKLKSDTALRNWLLAKMKKDGLSDAEAITMYDKVALATEMQSLPPSQWTPEMKALDQEMKNNPKMGETIKGYVRDTATNELSGLNKKQVAQAADATKAVAVEAYADTFDAAIPQSNPSKLAALSRTIAEIRPSPITEPSPKDEAKTASDVDAKSFPNAPDLGAHYEKAAAATEPLDGVKELKIAANDVKPQPAPSGMGGLEG